MFSIFKKTKKDDKYYFEQIQKRKKQVEKLNEEIEEMAKLALKDGKLQPVAETKNVATAPEPVVEVPKQQHQMEQVNVSPVAQQERENDYVVSREAIERIRAEVESQGNNYSTDDEEDSEPEEVTQPRVDEVLITISFVNGDEYKVAVPLDMSQQYVETIYNAMKVGATIEIGNRIINTKHIVYIE